MVRLLPVLTFAVAALSAGAHAKSVSATMAVRLEVEPSCHVAAQPMVFAGQAGQSIKATSEVRVVCNDDTPLDVRLDGGLHPAGTKRHMAGERGHVAYALYSDPARAHRWDAGAPLAGRAGPGGMMMAVYGLVEADETLEAGRSYYDTITVTVDF